jgi:mono/diheme cytochrome c family protein
MRMSRLWIVALSLALLLGVGLALAACGGSTTTTAAPATTAAPVTTVAPTTTLAPTTTTAAPTTTTAAPTTTEAPTTTVALDGQALFAQYCKGCHKNPPGAGLARAKSIITNGVGDMPGFKGKMTPEQIAALAAWIAAGGK